MALYFFLTMTFIANAWATVPATPPVPTFPMVTEWMVLPRPEISQETPTEEEGENWGVLSLPLGEDYEYDFMVDWGDGSPQAHVSAFDDLDRFHTYASPGRYTVTLTGKAESWQGACFRNQSVALLRVEDLGDMGWKDFSGAFLHCKHLTSVAVSDGDFLASVTNMSFMFSSTILAKPQTRNWNTSKVRKMEGMFYGAISANPDTALWDTSAVTSMKGMFYAAAAAEPVVSLWDVSSVTDMERMFFFSNADPKVSLWKTLKVRNMAGMFAYTTNANPDVSGWDTSNVIDMAGMFAYTVAANPDVSAWDVSQVVDMTAMFAHSLSARPAVRGWRPLALEQASGIFYKAISADPDTSQWETPLLKKSVGLLRGRPMLFPF